MERLLLCAVPVYPAASVVCTDFAGRQFFFTVCRYVSVNGLTTSPLAWMYQQLDTLMQPLLECQGPVPPQVSSLPTRETQTQRS